MFDSMSIIGPVEILFLLVLFILLIWIVFFIVNLPLILMYKKSNYQEASGVSLLKFLFNKGYIGECATYNELDKIPTYSKILVNLYIPTETGTTELDVVYICSSGIYVLESKNYSGWIFGSEKSRNWTVTIYKKKYKFPNPIWQNKKHIKYLYNIVKTPHINSIIVFSERCELRKINIDTIPVIKRNDLKNIINNYSSNIVFNNEQIDKFYEMLKHYGNKSDFEKMEHIERITNR
jgi:hypothetical protein